MGAMWSRVMAWFGSEKECRVLVLGLDFAGKTTFVNQLKLGTLVETKPTVGFNLETVQYKNVTFQVWDMGGQTTLRPLWRCYYDGADAIIWILDSVDKERLGLSKSELYGLLDEEELKNASLLILANKSDLACAQTVEEVIDTWDLTSITDRQWTVRPCSAKLGTGCWEAMDWLVSALGSKEDGGASM